MANNTLRFIHTGDWHIGNNMHGIDRVEETKQYFNFLIKNIQDNKIETLVVAGDIFDVSNPSNEARKLYFGFLASLMDTVCRNIIIVAGNHDSATLIDAPKELLDCFNITVVGSIVGKTPESLVKELVNSEGEVIGICAVAPFLRDFDLRGFTGKDDNDDNIDLYKEFYDMLYEEAERLRGERDIPIIATGHLHAKGIEGRPEEDKGDDLKDSGVRNIIGNQGPVSVSAFNSGFDYVALGHIHYTSMVGRNPKIRYSGSPFILGFDERNIPHHMLIVEAKRGENPIVQPVEIPQYFYFVRVEGNYTQVTADLMKLDSDIIGKMGKYDKPVKVEIVYEYRDDTNIKDLLSSLLENASFSVVNWKAKTEGTKFATELSDASLSDVSVIGDEEIFKRLVMSKSGKDEDKIKKFDEYYPFFKMILDEIENNDQ